MTADPVDTTRIERVGPDPAGGDGRCEDDRIAAPARACRSEQGSSMVAAIAIMFAVTFLGLVWLARDVDRARSNEGAAEAIAFQAARSGAQAASIGALRTGEVRIDPAAAASAATTAAQRLFASYDVAGEVTSVRVDVPARSVRVEVRITDGAISVTGVGIVTIEETP